MKPIVIEGMDSSGKSTLIYTLADKLRALVVKSHRKGPTEAEINQYHEYIDLFAPVTYPIICDRHPAISDLVYGPIVRNFTHSNEKMAQMMREDVFLIYCRPPIRTILETLFKIPQMDGVISHHADLITAYDKLMLTLEPDFIYDYTQPNEPQQEKLYELISATR